MSSGWCARRWWSARCCCAWRRISSGRCASCCRITPACGPPGCCGSACSSTIISAAASILPPTRSARSAARSGRRAARRTSRRGFEYSDCWVDDARLVVLNALRRRRARRRHPHAHALRRGRAPRRAGGSRARCDTAAARRYRARAGQRRRALGARRLDRRRGWRRRRTCAWSRAATSWCPPVRARPRLSVPERRRPHRLRDPLRGGLHADRHHRCRLCAAIPPRSPITTSEIDYLLGRRATISASPSSAAGYRLDLCGRAAALRRRRLQGEGRHPRLRARGSMPRRAAPLLTVYGGKITTYRRLAEQALERLAKQLDGGPAHGRRQAPLPGGDFPPSTGWPTSVPRALQRPPPPSSARRTAAAPGARLWHAPATIQIIKGAQRVEDLGRRFGADLTGGGSELPGFRGAMGSEVATTYCGGARSSGLGSCRRNVSRSVLTWPDLRGTVARFGIVLLLLAQSIARGRNA